MRDITRKEQLMCGRPWPLGGFISFCPTCGDQMVASDQHEAKHRHRVCEDCTVHGSPGPDNCFSPDRKLGGT